MRLNKKIIIILLSFYLSFMLPAYAKDCNYIGRYISRYEPDEVIVKSYKDNMYNLEIGLFRLTIIDDAIGYCKNNVIYFKSKDASGNDIYGTFSKSGNKYLVTFIESSWEYLPNGTQYVLFKEVYK